MVVSSKIMQNLYTLVAQLNVGTCMSKHTDSFLYGHLSIVAPPKIHLYCPKYTVCKLLLRECIGMHVHNYTDCLCHNPNFSCIVLRTIHDCNCML